MMVYNGKEREWERNVEREERKREREKESLCGLIWWNIHYFVGKKPKYLLQYARAGIKENETEMQGNCMESSMKNSTAKEYFGLRHLKAIQMD